MAWTFVGQSSAVVEVASGNITLTEPASCAAGDLLVAFIGYRDSPNFILPAGWSLVAQQTGADTVSALAAIAGGVLAWIERGASSPALTFTRSGGDVAQGRIEAYRKTGTKSLVAQSSARGTMSSTALTTASITTTDTDQLIIGAGVSGRSPNSLYGFVCATDPNTGSGGSGTDGTGNPANGTWKRRFTATTTTGADMAFAMADAVRANAGATGAMGVQSNLNASTGAVVFLAAFHASSSSTYSETLTETVSSAAAQLSLATLSNAVSESAAAASSQSSALTQPATLAETVASASSETAGSIYDVSRSDDLLASEVVAASMTFVSALSETGNAAESGATAATFVTAFIETVTGSDNSGAAATMLASRAEVVAANDNALAGSILSGSRVENVSAQDSASAANTITRALSEQGSAAANKTASSIILSALAEAIGAGDDAIGSVVGGATTYDDVLTEAVSASEVAGISFLAVASRAETMTAAAAQSAIGSWASSHAEAVTPFDTVQVDFTIGAALAETTASSAAQVIAGVFLHEMAEIIAANDGETVAAFVDEAILETVAAADNCAADGGNEAEPPEVPADRIVTVPAERRISRVAAQLRTVAIATERRSVRVPAETRSTAVAAESRRATVPMEVRVAS